MQARNQVHTMLHYGLRVPFCSPANPSTPLALPFPGSPPVQRLPQSPLQAARWLDSQQHALLVGGTGASTSHNKEG